MPPSSEPFSVPDPLADAWDEMVRQNQLLQARNDPLWGSGGKDELTGDAAQDTLPGPPSASSGPAPDAKQAAARAMGVHNILDLIAKGEGTSSYDASYNNGDGAGRHYPTGWKRPTQLTVDEAINMAPDLRRASGGDAVGMYQFKPRTLNDLRGWLHLDGSETMTPALQDRMARELLHRHGYDHYLAGQIGSAKLQEGLASQWSSFAKDQSDLSRYGKGGRPVKARVPTREIQATIADAAKEGADEIQEMVDQGQLPPDWR